MSESAEEMGSILHSAVEGPGDDPGDVPQSVSIDINPSPQADRDEVTGQIAKDAVLQALDDAREETLEFVEEQRATVAAAGKRGGKKR